YLAQVSVSDTRGRSSRTPPECLARRAPNPCACPNAWGECPSRAHVQSERGILFRLPWGLHFSRRFRSAAKACPRSRVATALCPWIRRNPSERFSIRSSERGASRGRRRDGLWHSQRLRLARGQER